MDLWDRAGRLGGYGAALALTPYLVIKVSRHGGDRDRGRTGAGTALGARLPGRPLVFCAWVGTGFLVPLLPYAVCRSASWAWGSASPWRSPRIRADGGPTRAPGGRATAVPGRSACRRGPPSPPSRSRRSGCPGRRAAPRASRTPRSATSRAAHPGLARLRGALRLERLALVRARAGRAAVPTGPGPGPRPGPSAPCASP